jgi:hypothetical protein
VLPKKPVLHGLCVIVIVFVLINGSSITHEANSDAAV